MFDATTQTFANVLFDKLEEQGVDPKLLTMLRTREGLDLLAKLMAQLAGGEFIFGHPRYDYEYGHVGAAHACITCGAAPDEPHDQDCLVARLLWLYSPEFKIHELRSAELTARRQETYRRAARQAAKTRRARRGGR